MNKIFWIYIALIVLAPLPFGMVYSLFQAVFACGVFTLMLAWCVLRLKDNKGPAVGIGRIWPETVSFMLVLAWGIFQISGLSPESWHHPLWMEAGEALGKNIRGSISLARGDGFESIMRLVMYGAVFFLAVQLGRDRKRAEKIFWAITLAGTAYALYGLAMHLGGIDLVLWVEKKSTNVTGTLINRNSFATYMGLCVLCAAGLYLAGFVRVMQSGRTGKDRTAHIIQQAFVRGAPLLACLLILLTALFLTSSRAGVIASLAALLVLIIFLGILTRIGEWLYQVLTVSLLAAALGVFFLSGDGWLDRLTATDLEREARVQRYEQTWQAIEQSPWTGYGIGSYEQTFFIFADEKTVTSYMAHNDWLEMIFELGVPIAILWFAVLGGLGARCLVGFFRRGRDHLYPVAGFSACVLVGLHALADFSLQIPAVAITFAVVLGVGVAQSWSSVNRPPAHRGLRPGG
jgi:O-antigen ligase